MGGKTGGTTALPYGGGSVQSGTNTSAPSAAALASYQNVLGQLGNLPSGPYPGELVAGVNQQQMQGIGGINTAANYAQPYIQQAAGYANQAAQPITAAEIANYQNPFTQQVVNATEAQFANQNAQQQSALQGNAAAQGALALEIKRSRSDIRKLLESINVGADFRAVQSERQRLSELGGGCHQKIGVTVLSRTGGEIYWERGQTEAGDF
jgi:hypothetical protein